MTATIVEIAELCASQRARSLDLFEQLGATFTSLPADRQRVHAEAAHRHAWHAELWASRTPAIPGVDLDEMTAARRTDADLLAEYSTLLADMVAELDEWAARIDIELDPSTMRTITLARTDLADLLHRIP